VNALPERATRYALRLTSSQCGTGYAAGDGEGAAFGRRGWEIGRNVTKVFIVQEGRPLFTVGAETLEGQPGQIIVVPPETPHKFVNIGDGPLRQIDIHASKRFITEWLEE
jgi:mannose-6-phosphate isomerase-like protein (cupin superfamily)